MLIVEVVLGRERPVVVLDLLQGDGGVGDGGIGSLLLVHDFDKEGVMVVLDLTDLKLLLPRGIVTSIVFDAGLELVVKIAVVYFKGEASIGVVLAEALMVLYGLIIRLEAGVGNVEEHRVGIFFCIELVGVL